MVAFPKGLNPDDFIVVHDVPLFDEHVGDDGTHYDERLLQCMAANNNRRIRDTGDYAPIVLWHTKDDGKPEEDPPVVGFAGPYYVAPFGNEDPRPCIYARDWFIHKDDLKAVKKRPRRSVEVWPEDKPENCYFDPIALLGAETPKRDLGPLYLSKSESGKRPYRYAKTWPDRYAAAPSGSNTFVPALKKPVRHQEEHMDNEIQQIVQGLIPVIKQVVNDTLDERGVGGQEEPLEGEGLPPEGPPEGMPPGPEGMPPEGMPPAGGPDGMPAGGPPEMPPEGEDEEALKLNKMDPQPPMDTASRYKKERDDWKGRYQKAEGELSKAKARYQKAESEVKELQEEVSDVRQQHAASKREVILYQKSMQGYVFDLPTEVHRTSEMSETEFDRYLSSMDDNCNRVPAGDFVRPAEDRPLRNNKQAEKYAQAAADIVQKYRKQRKELPYAQVLKYMQQNGTGKFDLEEFEQQV